MASILWAAAAAKGLFSFMGAKASARAYDQNASIAIRNEIFAKARGEREAKRARMVGARRVGEQKAAYARAGVDVQSGSSVLMYLSTIGEAEREAQNILLDTSIQMENFRNEADKYRRASKGAVLSGFLDAGSALLEAYTIEKYLKPGPVKGGLLSYGED